MRKKLFILSVVCLILFAITAQAELSTTEWKGLSPGKSCFQPLPNLAETKTSQFSFNCQSNNLIMNNKVGDLWDWTKRTWHGPAVGILTKITTKSNRGFFLCISAHSFTSSITDAKAHSRGKMKYFSGEGDWHMWKNFQDIFAAWATLHIARQIFIEDMPVKEVLSTLGEGGLLRFILFNANMKIVKGGFGAYNDPRYNEHALPYWWFENGKFTDKYISTGRITTPLFDGLAAAVLIARWSGWLETPFLDNVSVCENMLVFSWAL